MIAPNRRRGSNGKSERSNELAKIHIAKAQIPLDDETYRDMLWTVARVRSAKDLDAGGREAVLRHLKRTGWKDRATTTGETRYKKGTPAALIRWLWTQLHKAGAVSDSSDRALRRYIGGHLPGGDASEVAPQHLNRQDTTLIIEQLKKWHARLERGEPGDSSS